MKTDSGNDNDSETSELVSTHAELGDENVMETVACSTSNLEESSMDDGLVVKKDVTNSAGKEGPTESRLVATKHAMVCRTMQRE